MDLRATYEVLMKQAIAERQGSGSFRTLEVDEALLDFRSNDYLGMARSSDRSRLVEEILSRSSEGQPLGAGAARLLGGNTAEHLTDHGPSVGDAEHLPPFFTRGVLLDPPAYRGIDALPASEPVSADELQAIAEAQRHLL